MLHLYDSVTNMDGDKCGGPYSLFIVLPTDDVCTLRSIRHGSLCSNLKAQLELYAGIPANIYSLEYPDGSMIPEDDIFLFGESIKDGTVLKCHLHESWEMLFMSVCKNNIEHVYYDGGVRLQTKFLDGDTEGIRITNMVRYRCFVAVYLASHRGFNAMVEMLLNAGVEHVSETPFGRTALHAAASQGHASTLDILVHSSIPLKQKDHFDQTAEDVAAFFGSRQCERKLRVMHFDLRGSAVRNAVSPTKGILSEPGGRRRDKSASPTFKRHYINSKVSFEGKPGASSRPFSTPGNIKSVFSNTQARCKSAEDNINDLYNMIIGHREYKIDPKQDFVLRLAGQNEITPNHDTQEKTYGLPVGHKNPYHTRCSHKPEFITIQNVPRDKQYCSVVEHVPHPTPRSDNEEYSPKPRKGAPVVVRGGTVKVYMPDVERDASEHNKSKYADMDGIGSGLIAGHTIPTESPERTSSPIGDHTVKRQLSKEKLQNARALEGLINLKRKLTIVESQRKSASQSRDSDGAFKRTPKIIPPGGEFGNKPANHQNMIQTVDLPTTPKTSSKKSFSEWLVHKKIFTNPSKSPITSDEVNERSEQLNISNILEVCTSEVRKKDNLDVVDNMIAYRAWLLRRNANQRKPKQWRSKCANEFMKEKHLLEEKRQKLLIAMVPYKEFLTETEDKKYFINVILSANMAELTNLEKEIGVQTLSKKSHSKSNSIQKRKKPPSLAPDGNKNLTESTVAGFEAWLKSKYEKEERKAVYVKENIDKERQLLNVLRLRRNQDLITC